MGGGVFIGGGGRGEGAGTPKPAATPVARAKAGGRERGFIDNKKVTEGMRRLDRDAGMTAKISGFPEALPKARRILDLCFSWRHGVNSLLSLPAVFGSQIGTACPPRHCA